MNILNRIGLLVAIGIVASMNVSHKGYETHWWWDNIAHFFSGFALGLVLPSGKEREYFIVIATVWEAFEWKLATMKLYNYHELIPEGPRAMGYEGWSFDHQVEDTILDTVVGDFGVQMARKLKGQY